MIFFLLLNYKFNYILCLSVSLSLPVFMCLSVCLLFCLSVSACLCLSLPISVGVCLSMSVSLFVVCLSVSRFRFLSLLMIFNHFLSYLPHVLHRFFPTHFKPYFCFQSCGSGSIFWLDPTIFTNMLLKKNRYLYLVLSNFFLDLGVLKDPVNFQPDPQPPPGFCPFS